MKLFAIEEIGRQPGREATASCWRSWVSAD
jgi:hypothetical protein